MPIWGQLALQNRVNSIIECIIYFHDYIVIILLIILILSIYIILIILFKNQLDKESLESHFLEIIWTVIPIIILLFIAYPSLIILYFIEASETSNIEIRLKVIAHQWYWEYEILIEDSFDSTLKINPDNFYTLETTNYLVLPLNKIINLFITSADVIHRFTIPRFGVKVDAIPSRINILNFNVNIPGVYYGQCREICGANHRFIPIHILIK